MSAPSDRPDPTTTTPAAPATTTTNTPAAPARRRFWQRRPGGDRGSRGPGPAIARVRTAIAQVVWALCALAALILAVAALLIAIDANTGNDLVEWLLARADNVDLGVFDLSNPVKDWDKAETDPSQDVKTALFNYGIAAIVWLILGRVLDRIIRPGK